MRAHLPRLLMDGEPTGLLAWPCERFLARCLGCWRWSGRVPRGLALWIAPCRSIQTLALPRPIEVAFCDATGRVLRIVAPMAPHRLAWCAAAASACEMRAGTSVRLDLRVGRRLQRGAAMIEFAMVAMLGLLPLILGILQITALLVAHDVTSLATFQAAREGAMRGADASAMQSALARGLLPLYVPVSRAGQVPPAQALAGFARALLEVRTLDELAVIEPTREAVRGLLERRSTHQVLPNAAIESRSPALQAASVLTIGAMHCQPLVVPLVGPALSALLVLTAGSGTGAEARCRGSGRVPLRARASLVMQSDLPLENLP